MKHFLPIAGLILFAHLSVGQTPGSPVILTIDHASKSMSNFEALDDLNKGDWYQVVINNINSQLYSINVNHNDCTITTALPPLSFETFGVGDLTGLVSSLVGTTAAQIAELSAEQKAFNEEFLIGQKGKKPAPKVPDVTAEISALLDFYNRGMALNQQGVEIVDNLNRLVLNAELLSACAQLETTDPGCVGLDGSVANMVRTIVQLRANYVSISDSVKDLQQDYTAFYTKNKALVDANATLKELNAIVKTNMSALEGNIKKIGESLGADKFSDLIAAVTSVANVSDSYISLPQQFNGDIGTLTIEINPRKDSKQPLHSYSTKIGFPNRRWYGGVGTSFYLSGLYDEAYSIQETATSDTTSTFQIMDENPSKLEMGMSVLLRFGWRLGQRQNIGLNFTFGPGISLTKDIRPRFLLGGGVAVGRRHMLVLDGGFITGSVNVRSALYQEGIDYSDKPESVVVSKLAFSGFGSIGYVFSF